MHQKIASGGLLPSPGEILLGKVRIVNEIWNLVSEIGVINRILRCGIHAMVLNTQEEFLNTLMASRIFSMRPIAWVEISVHEHHMLNYGSFFSCSVRSIRFPLSAYHWCIVQKRQ